MKGIPLNASLLYAIITLTAIGSISAVILYLVAKKFKVIEDPLIDEVNELLPGANCGGCGLAGCRALAEAIVNGHTLDGFNCPVGGSSTMTEIGKLLGLEAGETTPMIAVVRCNGSFVHASSKLVYQGPSSCAYAHGLFSGPSGCPNGCLGLGDCVRSCLFDAMEISDDTGLPVISEENCVACGACVKACPRSIIELRKKGPKGKRIFVSCMNTEKGAQARKNCDVACIGCGKCVKVCPHDAITMENNLAYIDFDKCKLCRKCVPECPTNAILEINFPLRKEPPKIDEPAVAETAV